MRLASPQARQRLAAADHGVLCTVHHERGADAVPVVFAVIGDHLAVPIDRVKPKSTVRLQRERNLATDPGQHCWSSSGMPRTGRVCGGCVPNYVGRQRFPKPSATR